MVNPWTMTEELDDSNTLKLNLDDNEMRVEENFLVEYFHTSNVANITMFDVVSNESVEVTMTQVVSK